MVDVVTVHVADIKEKIMLDRTHPVRGSVYTLKEIEKDLYLRDSPFLFFDAEGRKVIQTSHGSGDLSDYEEWADIRFTFIRETHEWIPLFNVVAEDNEKLLQLLDSGEVRGSETLYWPKVLGSYI